MSLGKDIAMLTTLVALIGDVPLKRKVIHLTGLLLTGTAGRTAGSGFFVFVASTAGRAAGSGFVIGGFV